MMNKVELSSKQRELIERLGVSHEKSGIPPAPSRILGLLMVSPELALSFDSIRETLNLSKSATSNALNMLLTMNRIEYITQPGDRKRSFKNRLVSWREEAKTAFERITQVSAILEEVLENRTKETPEFNENLREAISFMRFMNQHLPELYLEWEKSKD